MAVDRERSNQFVEWAGVENEDDWPKYRTLCYSEQQSYKSRGKTINEHSLMTACDVRFHPFKSISSYSKSRSEATQQDAMVYRVESGTEV